jgi:hypothetical protein
VIGVTVGRLRRLTEPVQEKREVSVSLRADEARVGPGPDLPTGTNAEAIELGPSPGGSRREASRSSSRAFQRAWVARMPHARVPSAMTAWSYIAPRSALPLAQDKVGARHDALHCFVSNPGSLRLGGIERTDPIAVVEPQALIACEENLPSFYLVTGGLAIARCTRPPNRLWEVDIFDLCIASDCVHRLSRVTNLVKNRPHDDLAFGMNPERRLAA